MRFTRTVALAAFAGACFLAQGPSFAAGSPEKGRTAYVKNGCWQCHGYEGQGGAAGPKLAPGPMAFDVMEGFIRYTNGAMPPYPKAVLSDADFADIHAYLVSIPKAKDYKSIPLLNR